MVHITLNPMLKFQKHACTNDPPNIFFQNMDKLVVIVPRKDINLAWRSHDVLIARPRLGSCHEIAVWVMATLSCGEKRN
jgi:hypothetical protein